MPVNPVITLTTDFGVRDPFAGVMKGVILSTCPAARIIDLTHSIDRHDIRAAAFLIEMNYRYFPDGTIHVVVVDPGVGSRRRPIIVQRGSNCFVGPDNGVFSLILSSQGESVSVRHVRDERYVIQGESPTFQGRDVFAPVAAHLACGTDISLFGEIISDYTVIDLPLPCEEKDNSAHGEVISIDSFGNAITNICVGWLPRLSEMMNRGETTVSVAGMEVAVMSYYAQAPDASLYALLNSSGCLELFVNSGEASSFGISIGTPVRLSVS